MQQAAVKASSPVLQAADQIRSDRWRSPARACRRQPGRYSLRNHSHCLSSRNR